MRAMIVALVLGVAGWSFAGDAPAQDGKRVYDQVCAGCHNTGLIGAPKLGVAADWTTRLKGGAAALHKAALAGTAKGMPPRGGRADLPDADVRAAVDYMIARAGGGASPAPSAAQPARADKPVPASKPAPTAATGPATPAAAAPPPAAPAPAPVVAAAAEPARIATAPVVAPSTAPGATMDDVNAFNRLLRPAARGNLPPAEDGIHDAANDATHTLQPPLASFGKMPKSSAGNRVNWVAALTEKLINPRWDRNDPKAEAVVMDLNIVREVKGSMPDVVYPHKQHTEWLDCSNCHPALFIPQKGANQISMAAILLGQACGTCHGKVAFPVSECRLCHSRKKDTATTGAPAAAPVAGVRR